MSLSVEQVKGRIKNIAKENSADARVLIRIYMMERFLERVAKSEYSSNFIVKGGILVTSMVGIAMRSTMDIDSTIRNMNLSDDEIVSVVKEISGINLDDGILFQVKDISTIMDEMEYPGIRITMDAIMGKMITPIKIDISTGDVITPRAVEYSYKLMLEDRVINLWAYNLETILAEKMQTVLSRGILNTRMRDFYDIHMLLAGYANQIDTAVLKRAFYATCEKRESLQLVSQGKEIINNISNDDILKKLWESYQRRYSYASDIIYDDVISSVIRLYNMM